MSAGIGGSYGQGKSKQSSEAASMLQKFASSLLGETAGLRSTIASTLKGLITKKGETDFTDISPDAAMETAKRQSAVAARDAANDLAKMGLAGTPYGAGIVSNIRAEGGQNIANIQAQYDLESKTRQQNLFQTLLSLATQYTTGQTGTAVGGLGAAVPGNVRSSGSSMGLSTGTSASFPFGGK
jgi:hypothetical protein